MMMIIEVPESVLFADMNIELQKQIHKLNGNFAESILIGTKAVSGKKLIFVYVEATAEQVDYLTNNEVFDSETGEQIAFDLGWKVLASEDTQVEQSLLLPYFVDVPVLDENGDVIGSEPVTDLTDRLQVWAGKKWIYS